MKVELISITKPVHKDIINFTPEELIVYIARVSNPSNQMNNETSERLIRFLIKNKHWSPFEQVILTFAVETSRAIAAQILRHWSFRFQEFSQRYAEAIDVEEVELRKQGVTNRQSSEEKFDPYIGVTVAAGEKTYDYYGKSSELCELSIELSKAVYREMIGKGVAKECARMILPMATQTKLYMTASVRDWIFYLKQRTDLHAQLEHRNLANEIKPIFEEIFPNIKLDSIL